MKLPGLLMADTKETWNFGLIFAAGNKPCFCHTLSTTALKKKAQNVHYFYPVVIAVLSDTSPQL